MNNLLLMLVIVSYRRRIFQHCYLVDFHVDIFVIYKLMKMFRIMYRVHYRKDVGSTSVPTCVAHFGLHSIIVYSGLNNFEREIKVDDLELVFSY